MARGGRLTPRDLLVSIAVVLVGLAIAGLVLAHVGGGQGLVRLF